MDRKSERRLIQEPLERFGFKLTQQGGGQVNYQRTVGGASEPLTEILCNAVNGEVPEDLDEEIELYRFREEDGPEKPYRTCTLREYLEEHAGE